MAISKSDRVAEFVSPALRHAFVRTIIEVTRGAIKMTAVDFAQGFRSPFYVITAHNPLSKLASDAENDRHNRQLENKMQRANHSYWPAVGSDPFSDWAEASFAIAGIDRSDIIEYCRAFKQWAYFEVTTSQVIVHGVYSPWLLSRDHSTPGASIGTNSLALAAAPHTNATVDDAKEHLRYCGWEHVATSEERCAPCDSPADLYATIHVARQGMVEEHLALVCHQCGRTASTDQLRPEKKRLLELFYDYQVALVDSGQPPSPDEMSARTYQAYSAGREASLRTP